MDRDVAATEIKEFLEETFPNPGQELTESTDLLNDWLVDSLGIVMIIAFFEETFGIEVKQTDITGESFGTVASLSEYVVKHMST